MPRYVAFLRAVGPMNASMPALRNCFERAGFARVTTVLSSGNVVFDARAASERALERKAEAAMAKALGRTFFTIVRPVDALKRLIDADPYAHPFDEAWRGVYRLRPGPAQARVHAADREDLRHRRDHAHVGYGQEVRRGIVLGQKRSTQGRSSTSQLHALRCWRNTLR